MVTRSAEPVADQPTDHSSGQVISARLLASFETPAGLLQTIEPYGAGFVEDLEHGCRHIIDPALDRRRPLV